MVNHFLLILLQGDPLAWLQKLADQGLSLGILGLVSWIFWKQIRSLQNRLDDYQNEDRREMIDALNRNSEVMERMEAYLKRN